MESQDMVKVSLVCRKTGKGRTLNLRVFWTHLPSLSEWRFTFQMPSLVVSLVMQKLVLQLNSCMSNEQERVGKRKILSNLYTWLGNVAGRSKISIIFLGAFSQLNRWATALVWVSCVSVLKCIVWIQRCNC